MPYAGFEARHTDPDGYARNFGNRSFSTAFRDYGDVFMQLTTQEPSLQGPGLEVHGICECSNESRRAIHGIRISKRLLSLPVAASRVDFVSACP